MILTEGVFIAVITDVLTLEALTGPWSDEQAEEACRAARSLYPRRYRVIALRAQDVK